MRELVDMSLPSLQKHHLKFLKEQTPALVSAIKYGTTRGFLGRFYLKFINTFPDQKLTLSPKPALERIKVLEAHIYVSDDFIFLLSVY